MMSCINKEKEDETQKSGLNKLLATGKLLGSLNIDFHQLTGIDNLWALRGKKNPSADNALDSSSTSSLNAEDLTIDEQEETHESFPLKKRIWIKREGKNPTTIFVSPGMLVDDLKYTITKNYPTTLALECDPSEININATVSPDGKNAEVITLKPDLDVYKFLDDYFPDGMKIIDTFTISIPTGKGTIQSELKQRTKHFKKKEKQRVGIHEKDQGQIANSKSRNLRQEGNIASQTSPENAMSASTIPSVVLVSKRKVAQKDEKSTRSSINGSGSQKSSDRFHARNGTQNWDGIKSQEGRSKFSLSTFNNLTGSDTHRRTINDMKLRPNAGISKILSHINVLVVEDNLVNQKIMARHLKSCKVGFKIASNGREALEMWKEGGFHLCFMDIQLPVMSGLEVTREIRRLEKVNRIGNFPTSQLSGSKDKTDSKAPSASDKLDLSLFRSPIIIVALTASTGAEDRQEALAVGCNDYLTKPVQLKWLRSKLTEWGCMQALINYDHFRGDY